MSQILRPNTDRIASEVIDAEVIIIDLELGNYYNLGATAADIWLLLEQQPTLEDLIAALARRYSLDQAVVAGPVHSFVEELAGEALIVREEALQRAAGAPDIAEAAQEPFTAPVLNKYTNMSDLLLLDPIHDIDNKGWPIAKTEN